MQKEKVSSRRANLSLQYHTHYFSFSALRFISSHGERAKRGIKRMVDHEERVMAKLFLRQPFLTLAATTHSPFRQLEFSNWSIDNSLGI
jgi:hypothetical protein